MADYPVPSTQADALGQTITPADPGLDASGSDPLITPDQIAGNFYTDGALDSLYEWDMGFLQVPTGNPDGPCEIISVHQPICVRVFEWTVERVGQAPVAPSWVTNNPNEVLIEKRIYPASPTMGPDGTLVIRRSGRYVYGLIQPPGDQDPLFAGVPPYMAIPPAQMNVQPSDFDQNLSNTSSTVPARATGVLGTR